MRNSICTLIGRLTIVLLFSVGVASCESENLPTLNVYTYDSFASQWGPGPKIKEKFEKQCKCVLNYVATDGSTAILSRVQFEGARSRADVVLGLDSNLIVDAQKTGLLKHHRVNLANLDIPFTWDDPIFLPFDYGYFAFIYNSNRLVNPPTSMQALVEADDSLKIIIQDPRSSTPGLGLVLWIKALYGKNAAAVWRELSDKIVTVTKSWSEAYGLFLDGEADMVLSYTTSPAYHMIMEDINKYQAAAFSEGHGMQIEVAAQLANAPNPELAQQFMEFIATEDFQAIIPTGNWMYPVKNLSKGLPAAFNRLVKPATSISIDPLRAATNRAAWVDEFSQALSR